MTDRKTLGRPVLYDWASIGVHEHRWFTGNLKSMRQSLSRYGRLNGSSYVTIIMNGQLGVWRSS